MDIVKILRHRPEWNFASLSSFDVEMCRDAANEIERLRTMITELSKSKDEYSKATNKILWLESGNERLRSLLDKAYRKQQKSDNKIERLLNDIVHHQVPVNELTIDEWIQYGIDRKYCSEPVCATHEGLPITKEEEKAWEEGFDACSPGVRLWAEGECPEEEHD